MTKTLAKLFFPILAISILAHWTIAYAHDNSRESQEALLVNAAETLTTPKLSVFGKAIDSVTTLQDLFYIGASNCPTDLAVTTQLTTANELIRCYPYLILKMGVYVQSDSGEWEKAGYDGKPISETFVLMLNGQVSFTSAGFTKYKLTVDSGSFYYTKAHADDVSLSPTGFSSSGLTKRRMVLISNTNLAVTIGQIVSKMLHGITGP